MLRARKWEIVTYDVGVGGQSGEGVKELRLSVPKAR